MLTYWPARPTWRAETQVQALVQLGFTPEEADAVLAASVVDQTDKCLFLNRNDMADRCDVVLVKEGGTGIDAVLVLECYLDLGSTTFEGAVESWPYNGALWVVAGNVQTGRAS